MVYFCIRFCIRPHDERDHSPPSALPHAQCSLKMTKQDLIRSSMGSCELTMEGWWGGAEGRHSMLGSDQIHQGLTAALH